MRLVRVNRQHRFHQLRDLNVNVLLKGAFDTAYVRGDNSMVVPTDTVKVSFDLGIPPYFLQNIVYVLAKKDPISSIEEFGCTIVDFFLKEYSHISEGLNFHLLSVLLLRSSCGYRRVFVESNE